MHFQTLSFLPKVEYYDVWIKKSHWNQAPNLSSYALTSCCGTHISLQASILAAGEYSFRERTDVSPAEREKTGPVAQLEEHPLCRRRATGSNPVGSIQNPKGFVNHNPLSLTRKLQKQKSWSYNDTLQRPRRPLGCVEAEVLINRSVYVRPLKLMHRFSRAQSDIVNK